MRRDKCNCDRTQTLHSDWILVYQCHWSIAITIFPVDFMAHNVFFGRQTENQKKTAHRKNRANCIQCDVIIVYFMSLGLRFSMLRCMYEPVVASAFNINGQLLVRLQIVWLAYKMHGANTGAIHMICHRRFRSFNRSNRIASVFASPLDQFTQQKQLN